MCENRVALLLLTRVTYAGGASVGSPFPPRASRWISRRNAVWHSWQRWCASLGDPQPGHETMSAGRKEVNPPTLESGIEEESSLCFSLRPLLELRMRLAPCVVLRFGAARSQGGRSSLRPARVSGIKDASAEGTAVLFKTGANAAVNAVYSGAAARVELLLLEEEEEEATDVRRTNASRAWRAGRRAVRSAGSAIEAIAMVFPRSGCQESR